ncbi:unnamed protein product [Diatraea saccharalis]|uniref:Pacifastin domain-containing protein n=1 Tax=Diatraea saccharalis TaxID=40085 RepID=A0A9N9RBB8_9NEOP|nr:unnamed protein product [Diatraea saccharalis]
MLMSVIFIALASQFQIALGTKHACVPNTEFVLNGQLCFCDKEGWWNKSDCSAIGRRTCTPGQIIWQGCNQCICQENQQLICNNEACYGDTSSEDTHKSDLILPNFEFSVNNDSTYSWCTPYKSFYVNCSICVCSATGKTSEAHCVKDHSCPNQPSSNSDFLTSINKNICIPKVMYLFSCIHCLCSDGGYFILNQCVETCHRPQQSQMTRRCISRTFYMKDCNVCWCTEDGVADDKYCTKNICNKASSYKSLESLKTVRRKCQPYTFAKPRCFYCTCDANGNLNENACLESDCIKSEYFKYDLTKQTCSPGEMVPICQECFCLRGELTNQSYCSQVCSYQSKLSILEKMLMDNQGNTEIIEKEYIQHTSEGDSCQPNSVYLDHNRFCLCPENGSTNFKLCTSIIEDTNINKPNDAFSSIAVNTSLSISCEPSSFVEIDCNTCYCGKNGKIDPKWCTNDDCDAKRIIQIGQTSLRDSVIDKINDTCVPGSVTRVGCNFCICPQSGIAKERACTKNVCSDFQEVYDEKFVCEPLAYYLVDCNVCLCPHDGVKNVEKCTKKVCEKTILRSDSCTPGQFFSNECNVCVCPPNGNKADRVCTRHKCSDLDTPWRKIFRLSQSLLDSKTIQAAPVVKQDLDFCFSGEEFEIDCRICVCPDVGLKSHATCSDDVCDEKNNQDNNRLDVSIEIVTDNTGTTVADTEVDESPIPHNHTIYKCTKPGKVLDECYICECKHDVIIEEHCFKSDADECENAKASFLDTVNKVVLVS